MGNLYTFGRTNGSPPQLHIEYAARQDSLMISLWFPLSLIRTQGVGKQILSVPSFYPLKPKLS